MFPDEPRPCGYTDIRGDGGSRPQCRLCAEYHFTMLTGSTQSAVRLARVRKNAHQPACLLTFIRYALQFVILRSHQLQRCKGVRKLFFSWRSELLILTTFSIAAIPRFYHQMPHKKPKQKSASSQVNASRSHSPEFPPV